MPQPVTHLSAEVLDALREVIRRELHSMQGGQAALYSQRLQHDDVAVGIGALTAGSTTSPGSGLASFLRMTGGAYAGDTSALVYNLSTDAVSADKIYMACRERLSGEWFAVTASGGQAASIQWGRSQANWEKNAGDPRVSVKAVSGTPRRSSSTVSGGAFYVYLPRTGSDRDPNVASGQNIPYLADPDTWICVGDYLDAKIGSVKMWVGDKADIPIGWAIMDGVANAAGNGGSGIVMVSGSDQYFPLATDIDVGGGWGAVGTNLRKDGIGGLNTVTVPAHDATSIDDHNCSVIDAHGAAVTGDAGSHDHGGVTGQASGEHTHSGATQDDGAHDHGGYTGNAGAHDHGGATGDAGAHDHGAATGDAGEHDHGAYTGEAGQHSHGGATEDAGAHDHGAATGDAGSHDHGAATGDAGGHDHTGVTGQASGEHSHIGATQDAGNHDHGAATGDAGSHDHGGTTGSNGAHDHDGGGTVGGNTELAYTNVTTTTGYAQVVDTGHDHPLHPDVVVDFGETTSVLGSDVTDTNIANVIDNGHTHPVDDPMHLHAIDDLVVTIPEDGAHTHTISSALAHSHSITAELAHHHDIIAGDLSTEYDDHTHTITAELAHSHSIVSELAHSHTITAELAHSHVITDELAHQHNITTVLDHSHAISAELDHSHTVTAELDHQHTVAAQLAHSHQIYEGDLSTEQDDHTHTIAGVSAHSHSTPEHVHSGTLAHNITEDLDHDAVQTIPEFVNLMFIERLDNSSD